MEEGHVHRLSVFITGYRGTAPKIQEELLLDTTMLQAILRLDADRKMR